MPDRELHERIKQAELVFVSRASRLLDEAENVRRQRDELLDLLRQADAAESQEARNA
jgi:hypothetical protein